MYEIKSKEDFIIITGSNIIKYSEAKDICEELVILLANRKEVNNLLLDLQEVNLDKSKFDIFIQYLSKMDLNKIALLLPKLISSFKFKLWRRKYKKYVNLNQFSNLSSAKSWLAERS